MHAAQPHSVTTPAQPDLQPESGTGPAPEGGDSETVRPRTRKKVDAYKADTEKETVILLATEFRLTDVLAHIEAGRIVRVIPAPRKPAD